MSMKIGIIGAGAGGLCAARHVVAASEKFEPLVFEQSDCVGGTWVYTDSRGKDRYNLPIHSSMYKHLKTNLPKEIMAFPDFPFQKGGPSFVGHEEVHSYLKEYADHFGLNKFIKFQNSVVKVVPLDDCKGWIITARNVVDQSVQDYTVRYLLVCNGHYSIPKNPNIPGLEHFKGTVMHSHDYREPKEFTGKSVLCLGAGSSGQDITLEIATTAERVYLSHNRPRMKAPLPANVIEVHGVSEAVETGFKLTTGEVVEADMLLLCTGYHFTFPFLPEGFLSVKDNRVHPLYKHLIHTRNPSVCFVGIPLTILPFPFFDIQVRFFMKYVLGNMSLPPQKEMEADTEAEFQRRLESGLPARHAHLMGTKQWAYQDDLSRLGDLKPSSKAVRDLYDSVHDTRTMDLCNYKKCIYRILDENRFERLQ